MSNRFVILKNLVERGFVNTSYTTAADEKPYTKDLPDVAVRIDSVLEIKAPYGFRKSIKQYLAKQPLFHNEQSVFLEIKLPIEDNSLFGKNAIGWKKYEFRTMADAMPIYETIINS